MAIATGQFTIIDYNDALTLTGYIGSNLAKTQQYNPDNGGYNPDWVGANLVLTPSLFKLGGSSDIITNAEVTSVAWYILSSGVETALIADANHVLSGTKSQVLTIKVNDLAGIAAKDYICKLTYHDSSTNLDLTYKMSISFNRVINGGGIADAVSWCPKGNVFKNGSIASVIAHCDLWRGSVIDITNVTYQWYKQDSSVVTDQGGGIGWRKLDGTTNYGITAYTSNEITIPDAAVDNYAVFKCQIKDTDSASNTYNQYFYDTVSVVDQSDTVQLTITSSGGGVFKNGAGSTTLTAKVYRAGVELDSGGTIYTYHWFKYDSSGNLVTSWGGATDYKTGKTLSVGDSDVDTKATFSCEIS